MSDDQFQDMQARKSSEDFNSPVIGKRYLSKTGAVLIPRLVDTNKSSVVYSNSASHDLHGVSFEKWNYLLEEPMNNQNPEPLAMAKSNEIAETGIARITTWIVQRIEEHGQLTRTQEMPQEEADKLYDNWANNAAKYNDQSVSLIRVDRTESVLVASHTNTKYRTIS